MTEKATFGAGCFWGVEETFRKIPGVVSTAVGYTGGTTENPTYKDVCTDRTGHAEVVQVEYDPAKVSYEQLLEVFWANHNPTTLNSQGPDHGRQYRSAIFYHTPEQQTTATASRDKQQRQRPFPAAHRDGDHAGRDVLPGRGLSSTLSGEAARPIVTAELLGGGWKSVGER